MGRIKTAQIKRITKKLLRDYSNRFTNQFEGNKKVVNELTDISFKKIRNIIAGYITRLKQVEESNDLTAK